MKPNRYRYIAIGQTESETWKKLHEYNPDPEQFVFTASTAAKLFGLSGSTSAKKLYELYVGIKQETRSDFDRKAMDHGNLNEPYGLAAFYNRFPHYVGIKPGMIMHKTYDWLGASLDNIAINTITGEMVNIEVKCPFSAAVPQYAADVNQSYLVQVATQTACIEQISYSYLVYYKEGETEIYKIERSQLLEDEVVKSICAFRDLVSLRVQPKIGAFTARKRLGDLWNSVIVTKMP